MESDFEQACAIIEEYSDAIDVTVRDDPKAVRKYLELGSGLWLAKSNNQIVGCIAVRPLPQIAGACEVKRLYVKPEFRKHGIADRLLNALHEYAATSYEWAYLDSKDDLQAAIKFYLRNGYENCERYNDNPQATIFMRRKLST